MTYSVATFEVIWDGTQNLFVREYTILGKNLSLESAQEMKKANRGSWTYQERYHKES